MDGWNIDEYSSFWDGLYSGAFAVRFRVYYNRLFFSAKERLTSGLSAEAELRRSGGGSLDARGGSTSLVAWWEAWLAVCLGPGGRKARMKPITYIPSCHLKLTANAPKNRPSPKGNSSSNHPFFRGELLNFGGVTNPQNITQESIAWKMSNTDHVHPRKFHSTYDNHNNFLWHSQKRRR